MLIFRKFFILAGTLLLPAGGLLLADTIILNSGEQVQGTVIKDGYKELVVKIQISAGISDERTFAKKDVKEVVKTAEDVIAFEKIKNYKIGVNSYPAASYELLVRALDEFVTKYPSNTHLSEIKANLEAIKEEQARVVAGSTKWNNHWYTAKELADQKYQIEGAQVFAAMQDLAARGDTIGALNKFDFLEKNYGGAAVYPTAIETAIVLINRLAPEVERAIEIANRQEAQFKEGIVLVAEPQKTQTIKARKAQIAAADKMVTLAEKTGVRWKPLLAISDKSLKATENSTSMELPRLSAMQVPAMRSSIEKADEADAALKKGDLEAAEAAYRESQTLWATNEMLSRLEKRIAVEKAKPKPTPTPSPSASPSKARAKN